MSSFWIEGKTHVQKSGIMSSIKLLGKNMRSQPATGYVKDTGTTIGRGVYASRSISPGETVEICPVILVSGDFDDLPKEIRHIVFNWSVLAKMSDVHAIALGYGSMYNHSNPANLRYEACGNGQFLRFIAVSQIAKDAELTVNYNALGGYPTSDKDTWFEHNEIEPIQRLPE